MRVLGLRCDGSLLERHFDMDPITSSTLLTNGPTEVGNTDHAQEDHQLFLQLAELWRSHLERGLEVRWQTGVLLNRRLGPPTERLTHGKQVLKRVGEELQIAESDLNRMRWFALLFEFVKDLQAKHPKVRSWTKVKELLPTLIAAVHGKEEKSSDAGSSGEQSPGDEKDAALIGGVLRFLSTATERLRQGDIHVDEAGRQRLREALQQFVEAVSERLHIRLVIEKEDA